MSDVLQQICAAKREHVARRKATVSEGALLDQVREAPPPVPFATALDNHLAQGRYGLIAEIKKASPSRGLIRGDFDPAALARAYRVGGATCLSVLTDTPYFQGSDADLAAARAAVPLPILRKDFILDPYQIVESRAIGADCVLLIMAALSDAEAGELAAAAAEVGLDVLVEVHDRAELDRALALKARLIGINNRDLKTLAVDLATAEELAPSVPADRIVVAESGIGGPADLDRLAAGGARCFLVGESLMRERDVGAATRRLLRLPQFTHLDAEGRARMVDVSAKDETDRVAVAGARVIMQPQTLARIQAGDVAKGDVLAVARLAGIMAAKRTAELIPLCHPLALTSVAVELACAPQQSAVEITATCRLKGRTGVEMEALTAASVAALTVYDMCKAVDRGMTVTDLRLLRKSGGQSGDYIAADERTREHRSGADEAGP
ncbi:MAG: indole-3-glycerol phosphate synthase TrpC [Alphaproteobacteria bacterium]|nr:indole-3-glycerol phosphate synthase TrpC [Alphaproteobacteria bacterium]